MTFALVVAALALAQTAPAGSSQEPLGMAAIGSREVPIVAPAASSVPPRPTVDVAGSKWLLGSSGNLLRSEESDTVWANFRARYEAAQKKVAGGSATVWRTRLFVFTRGEILERRSDGVWRMRRSSLESNQVDEVFRGAALFKALVEAQTGGEVTVQVDPTVDDDPERLVLDVAPSSDLDRALSGKLLAPRFNDDAFEADDKVFRGPYQSVFGIHCLLRSFDDSPSIAAGRTPTSWIGFYTDAGQPTAAGLAEAMYRRWLGQVERRSALQGYIPAESCDPGLWSGVWPTLASTTEPTRPQYVQRRHAQPLGPGVRWKDLLPDPWSKVPFLDERRLAALAGIDAPPGGWLVGGEPEKATPLLNDRYEPGSEACALFGSGSNQVLLVRDDAANALSEVLEKRAGTQLTGYTIVRGRRALVYLTSGLEPGTGEALALGLIPSLPARASVSPPALEESLSSNGLFSVARQPDAERGVMLAVTERGAFRWGSATLLARRDGGPLFDLAESPTLEFAVKLESRDSFRLELLGEDGSPLGSVAIGSEPVPPIDAPREQPAAGTVLPATGTWVSVKAHFGGERSHPHRLVHAVRVVPSAYSRYLERRQIDPGRILFADFKLSDSSSDWGPSEAAPSEDERLARIAAGLDDPLSGGDEDALFDLLKNRSETVRLNAVAALTRAKSAKCLPLLIDQSKSATPAIAEMAMRALRFQGTEEAWAAVRWCVETGPFDHNRTSAARQTAERKDAKDAATVSVLLAARSWHARLAAAQALGGMASREASIILMAFLQETEPAVRLAVVEGADLTQELVNRRLLYLAVNDPSQAVRALSCVRLLETPIAEFRDEALKGVRDESIGVRLALLDAMVARPSETHRGALRLAVTDASPSVRSQALRAMAKLPGPVKVEEFENVLTDAHPLVQRALVELALAKDLRLPESALQPLLNSADPQVVELARGLPR